MPDAPLAVGAIGTIVRNNNPGNFFGTLGSFASAGPSVPISQADGLTLQAEIASMTTTADVGVRRLDDLYWVVSGTSFSGPHVAGVAALVKEANPNIDPAHFRELIEMTAENIGPNVLFANGMVRADNAVDAATTP